MLTVPCSANIRQQQECRILPKVAVEELESLTCFCQHVCFEARLHALQPLSINAGILLQHTPVHTDVMHQAQEYKGVGRQGSSSMKDGMWGTYA